jgi:hypothetical protein
MVIVERARPCAAGTAAGNAGGGMSTSAASHRVSAPCTHRLAGARAPLRCDAKRRAGAPLPPCWRAQTAALKVAPPSATVPADARRTRAHRAATPAPESNPHSAVLPLAPEPMARGFLPQGFEAYPTPTAGCGNRHGPSHASRPAAPIARATRRQASDNP